MSEKGRNLEWQVLEQETVLDHPYVTVAMETVQLPNGKVIPNWPKIYTHDYVNALVINEQDEALILEGYKHGTGWIGWQVLGGYLEEGEDPITAVKRELMEETGYQCDHWTYLGSYVVDANRHVGVGHFFFARGARQAGQPIRIDQEQCQVRWVPVRELKFALLDGRIAAVSYAINIALALLLL